MKEIIWGMFGSMLLYLALPDVGLSKPQTVLILIVGWMISTAAIWWVQEQIRVREEKHKRQEFRILLNKITL